MYVCMCVCMYVCRKRYNSISVVLLRCVYAYVYGALALSNVAVVAALHVVLIFIREQVSSKQCSNQDTGRVNKT